MEKGIDKLTGELAELDYQLSKAIPKGYTELAKEYARSHLTKAILNVLALLALVGILVFLIVCLIKYTKYCTKNKPNFTLGQDEFHDSILIIITLIGVLGLIFMVGLIVTVCCNISSNLERFAAPNYYMLKTFIGK